MHAWIVAALLAGSFDLTTTLVNLHHGCHEVSPMAVAMHVTTPVRITVVRGGAMVGISFFGNRLHDEHPTLANVVAGSMAAASTVAGVHNLRLQCGGLKP